MYNTKDYLKVNNLTIEQGISFTKKDIHFMKCFMIKHKNKKRY